MASASQPSVSNETITATYHRFATLYDWFVAPLEARTRARAVELISIDPDERILELGCGPGNGLVSLAGRLAESGHAIGLDAAPGMLDRARERVGGTAVAERCDLVRGDARTLPFEAESVDVVFIENTLELFTRTDVRAVLGEAARVLTPDGRIGVVTMERENAEHDAFVRAYEWAYENVPGIERFGCRPMYARRALEAEGFAIEHAERHRRGALWPVELLVARPR